MNRSVSKSFIIMLLIIFSIIFISGCTQTTKAGKDATVNTVSPEPSAAAVQTPPAFNGKLKVHYINVGKADSILLQQGSQSMLIDTGTSDSEDSIVNYIQSQNIKKLDYLVLTHPHLDHIGGAEAVLKTFDIGTVLMPKVTTNTSTFKNVINAIDTKGLKASQPEVGSTFRFGDADCIVLGPINTVSGDINTYSIVIKVTFGNNKFLFEGDAQASNEQDMLDKGFDLSADVLKVGHHGSNKATSQAFLDKVNPHYAVISCAQNNNDGLPNKKTMNKLKERNIEVYRTDECGTIVAVSDGNNISFNVKPGDYKYGGSEN